MAGHAPLCLRRFGIGYGNTRCIEDFDARFPARGLVAVDGPADAVATLCAVVARWPVPNRWSWWGEVDVLGVDHRIRSPLPMCSPIELRGSQTLGAALARGLRAEALLSTLQLPSGLERAAACRELLRPACARVGLDPGVLEATAADLTAAERARASVAAALLRGTPAVGVRFAAHKSSGHRDLADALERVATESTVVCFTPPAGLAVQTRLELRLASGPRPQAPPGWASWILWQRLAGLRRPGLFETTAQARLGLQPLQLDLCIGLEEDPHPSAFALNHTQYVHFPIPDMQAPTIEAAVDIVESVHIEINRGKRVAFHCKAGLGRTGTLLGATLIRRGYAPDQALALLRHIRPRYVQSPEQEAFMTAYQGAIRG